MELGSAIVERAGTGVGRPLARERWRRRLGRVRVVPPGSSIRRSDTRVGKRLRSEAEGAAHVSARHQINDTKPSRIVEDHEPSGRQTDVDVIILLRLSRIVRCVLDTERSRHAQMHDEHVIRRQLRQQVLATPIERANRPVDETFAKGRRPVCRHV